MLSLKAEIRDKKVKTDDIRKRGLIPAVFYGKKEPSTPIAIKQADFLKVWKEVGESGVISLETTEGTVESLIHDIDFHPITGTPRHADFYVFEKGHKVKVDMPIEFIGVSPAVKDLGGVLVKVMHAVKIEAMPKDLPHKLEVDISGLTGFDSQILAKDLQMAAGVTLLENPEEVVALVAAPREEKEEEVAPVDLSAIELSEKKGKDETAEDAAPSADKGAEKTESK